MSRIGKKPIKIVSGVKVNCKDSVVEVSGKLGTLKRDLPPSISLEIGGDEIKLKSNSQKDNNLYGLYRTLINNMVKGVSEGYTKNLELVGVGYRAQAKGNALSLQLGFSHPVEFPLPESIKAKVDANTKISLTGPDKELLGVIAAKLRKIRPPEPYKGKGIRYAGEVISLKQGKAAGK
ncbi:MAG: 50S ribosomal protein L6 [Bdellovibrionales bacterium]|nr:50S ribosomal protein L6 [Bdellovibrionales bacterium]MCB0417786.1 50S ribosomal protein L6 [Bdellovibrionales bacterium]MCB9253956.1 50S ribosomal protein L6 [Pseudobdellovibrionaceae bacterium]